MHIIVSWIGISPDKRFQVLDVLGGGQVGALNAFSRSNCLKPGSPFRHCLCNVTALQLAIGRQRGESLEPRIDEKVDNSRLLTYA